MLFGMHQHNILLKSAVLWLILNIKYDNINQKKARIRFNNTGLTCSRLKHLKPPISNNSNASKDTKDKEKQEKKRKKWRTKYSSTFYHFRSDFVAM